MPEQPVIILKNIIPSTDNKVIQSRYNNTYYKSFYQELDFVKVRYNFKWNQPLNIKYLFLYYYSV